MTNPIVITADDARLQTMPFKPFRSKVVRRVMPFMPNPQEEQFMSIQTPWGSVLTAKPGDFLISELDKPNDIWPIDATIFEETYMLIRPGHCVKKAITLLAPLTEITGDPDALVTVITKEGDVTVRSGGFFLAKGVQGEVWPYPIEKINEAMTPVED